MSACEWMSARSALAHFVEFRGATQSQEHIKPLHWREWASASAAFSAPQMTDLDYEPRIGS